MFPILPQSISHLSSRYAAVTSGEKVQVDARAKEAANAAEQDQAAVIILCRIQGCNHFLDHLQYTTANKLNIIHTPSGWRTQCRKKI
jgi:hypothetical protein